MFLDLSAFNLVHSFAGKMRVLDWFSVFLAEYAPYLIVAGGIAIILLNGSVRQKIERTLIGIFSFVISLGIFGKLFHFFMARPRPFEELGFRPLFSDSGAAFPSRHAITLFVIALMVFSVNRKWGYWFFGFAILNGIARVYAGVHWPSDVIGGLVLAAIGFYIASMFSVGAKENKSNQAEQVSENQAGS